MADPVELGWVEWSVVVASLATTVCIGLYFGKSGKGSLDDYMLGGKAMSLLPIILSITATNVSGLSMSGLAADTYLFGAQPTLLIPLSGFICAFLTIHCYLPVLHQFKNVSSFQYFDLRFNRHVRKLVSALFVFEAIQQSSICIYVPAAAFSEASGIPMPTIVFAIAIVCVTCAGVGGLKSVVWSDAVQAIVILFCTGSFYFLGITKSGGVVETVRKIKEGGRWEFFNFDPSLYTRYTVWGTFIGSITINNVFYFSPAFHQRYISLPTYQHSTRAIWLGTIVSCCTFHVFWIMGVIVYAYNAGCDPVLAKKGIKSYKMILPYFVNQVTEGLHGLVGLFHASVIAAGISTTTTHWNTVSCTVYEDFVRPYWKLTEKNSYRILICLLLVSAVLSGFGVLLAANFTNLYEAAVAFRGVTHSSICVLYNAALFFPWVNATGVISGAVTAAFLTVTIIVGAIRAQNQGLLRDVPKVLTTRYCNGTTDNSTILTIGSTEYGIQKIADPSVFWLFKISLCFYVLLGSIVGIFIAVVVSCLSKSQPLSTLNPDLIVPQMRWVFPTKIGSGNIDSADTPMLTFERCKANGPNETKETKVQDEE